MISSTIALHDALVAANVPIVGVSIGRADDKASWRVDYAEDATDEQKAAGQAVVDAFDPRQPSDGDINIERERRIGLGCVVTLSTRKEIPVQTRDDIDFRNLSLLSNEALKAVIGGRNDMIPFRDAENKDWNLTPAEVVEMTSLVAGYGVSIYKLSWALKALAPRPTSYADDQYWTP